MLELTLFLVLIVTRVIIEIKVVPRRWDSRQPTLGHGLFSLLLMGVAYFGSCMAVLYGLYRWGPSSPLLYYSGLLLLIVGYLGRIVSVRQLGAAYSQSFEADPAGRFVTGGLYSVIRHPVYTSFMLEMVALFLLWVNAVSAVAIALVALSIVYRIPKEEQQLIERFGKPYGAYRERTRAVIPYLL